jgi:peroxiredoxin
MDVQVIAVSTDFVATLSHWAKELDAQFPIASDHSRTVTKSYGIYNETGQMTGLATRTTFVIGPDGKIENIEEGNNAVDPTGAAVACERIKKKG